MPHKKIVVTRGGPYRVTGGVPLRRESAVPGGEGHPVEWRKGEDLPAGDEYCLCRCGQSKGKPFCDGTHRVVGFEGTETCDGLAYEEKCEKVPGPALELTDAQCYCSGGRFCKASGGTRDLVTRSDDPEAAEKAVAQACNCPSGRLVAWKGGAPVEPECEPSISVTEHPAEGIGGPYWVKGGVPVESEEGQAYEARNRVTLCRCGHSGHKPLCDGTHREVGFKEEV